MNLNELKIYKQPLLYVGAILSCIATYFCCSKNTDDLLVWALLILSLCCVLLAFKKPKAVNSLGETE
ncbi:MAG: hypothetical protein JWR50_2903 [Mucilaginibacter sp.]|nr:hypothetical protein [Mucilaginibacter sp.]